MKKLILLLAMAGTALAEGIPMTVLSSTTNSITFMAERVTHTNWYLYASPSLIYSNWVEVHHATQTPEPKTWVFTYFYRNPLPPHQVRQRQFFHARTDQLPTPAPPPAPSAPGGWISIDSTP